MGKIAQKVNKGWTQFSFILGSPFSQKSMPGEKAYWAETSKAFVSNINSLSVLFPSLVIYCFILVLFSHVFRFTIPSSFPRLVLAVPYHRLALGVWGILGAVHVWGHLLGAFADVFHPWLWLSHSLIFSLPLSIAHKAPRCCNSVTLNEMYLNVIYNFILLYIFSSTPSVQFPLHSLCNNSSTLIQSD